VKVLDLFSGIGGFSLGLERAGMETMAFCEFDGEARKVLKKNWPHVFCFNDVKTLSRELLYVFGYDRPDVICGGFPCQDVSAANRTGAGLAGERSGLFYQVARLAREYIAAGERVPYIVLENVSNLRARGLDEVLRELTALGYVCEWHCIPASYVGAWHRRDRIWILAYANGEHAQGRPPEPILRQSHLSLEPARRAPRWTGRPDLPASRFCRSLDDVPGGAHRLIRLGNAVVPVIPEIIGRAILERELLM
jgi:DNA (cytosine-5)-methyltransferase 1